MKEKNSRRIEDRKRNRVKIHLKERKSKEEMIFLPLKIESLILTAFTSLLLLFYQVLVKCIPRIFVSRMYSLDSSGG